MLHRRQLLTAGLATTALVLLEPAALITDPTWSETPFDSAEDYARLCRELGLVPNREVIPIVRERRGYRAKRFADLQVGDIWMGLGPEGARPTMDVGQQERPDHAYIVLARLPPSETGFATVHADYVPRSRWA